MRLFAGMRGWPVVFVWSPPFGFVKLLNSLNRLSARAIRSYLHLTILRNSAFLKIALSSICFQAPALASSLPCRTCPWLFGPADTRWRNICRSSRCCSGSSASWPWVSEYVCVCRCCRTFCCWSGKQGKHEYLECGLTRRRLDLCAVCNALLAHSRIIQSLVLPTFHFICGQVLDCTASFLSLQVLLALCYWSTCSALTAGSFLPYILPGSSLTGTPQKEARQ